MNCVDTASGFGDTFKGRPSREVDGEFGNVFVNSLPEPVAERTRTYVNTQSELNNELEQEFVNSCSESNAEDAVKSRPTDFVLDGDIPFYKSNFKTSGCCLQNTETNELDGVKKKEIGLEQYTHDVQGKSLDQQNGLKTNQRIQTDDKPCKSDLCREELLSTKNNLYECKRVHLDIKAYKCDVCEKNVAVGYLAVHQVVHPGNELIMCETCWTKRSNLTALEKSCGLDGHHTYGATSYLDAHGEIHLGDSQYQRELCGQGLLNTSSSLAKHEIAHTKEKPSLVCDVCGKTFMRRGNLNMHMRIHTGERPHACDVCGQSFTSKRNLQVHSRIHTGEKPYKCTLCGKQFAQHFALASHKRTHTGEKPFKCTNCGKGFAQAYALTIHLRIHTGEKPYTCSTCGMGFTSSSNLVIHQRQHSGEKPHSCSVCGKRFTNSSNLAQHLRTHTGEKPYSCQFCERAFGNNSQLTRHLRSHTGEKPFKCDVCEKVFGNSSHLTRHRRIHLDSAKETII